MSLSSWDLAGPSFPEQLALHRPAVRRFLAGRLRSQALADEATQETLVRAFVRRDTLADPDRLGPWLFGIAKRVLAEERRRSRKAVARAVPETVLECLPSASDQHAELAAKETSHRLHAGVAALPPEKRSALLLRVDDELGYAEIARRLGWSIPKVKNEIHRARLLLKAAIAIAMCVLPILIVPRTRPEASYADEGPTQCFESGIGLIAAFESERAACLMASPAPFVFVDGEPVCE